MPKATAVRNEVTRAGQPEEPMNLTDKTPRDKRAKFVELANKRVNRALKELELVANLSNRRNYEYDEEQARKIIKALQNQMDILKQSFNLGAQEKSGSFEI
jgi:hypothetical protein